MKQLYYTISYEVYDDSSRNGIRLISVYEIINNKPKKFCQIEALSDDLGNNYYTNSEEIQNYLDDNGYGDDMFEFIAL